MSGEKEVRFSMKLMMNKEKTKVLFALVDASFADVLLSFLTLPLGRILRLLHKRYGDKAPSIGSLNTLYIGLQNLDSVHFNSKAAKEMLLDPRSSVEEEYQKLKLDVFGAQQTKYFTCGCGFSDSWFGMYLVNENDPCRNCGRLFEKQIEVKPLPAANCREVFAGEHRSFLICDDLRMLINGAGSIQQTLTNLGIMDIDGAEYSTVSVGFNEVMDLLKGSLFSKTPLTDLFLHERHANQSDIVKPVSKSTLAQMEKPQKKKMKIKATVQLSQKRFLFAQSNEDFVEFLFSLLTIPLGQVQRLLKMDSPLGCIGNLYSSVENMNGYQFNIIRQHQNLLYPEIPYCYLSTHRIFALDQCSFPDLYYHGKTDDGEAYLSPLDTLPGTDVTFDRAYFRDPRGSRYVKVHSAFMITNDLTVTPLCVLSSLSFLKGLNIPLSDTVEVEVDIGIEEALNLLKASLTSSCALTNVLKLDTAFWKQPKQEKH